MARTKEEGGNERIKQVGKRRRTQAAGLAIPAYMVYVWSTEKF
jgi:hypothetical protein